MERLDHVLMTFVSLVDFGRLAPCPPDRRLRTALSLETLARKTSYPLLLYDELIGSLVLSRLQTLGQLSPWGARMSSTFGPSFAAAQRMIDRVHGRASHRGPYTHAIWNVRLYPSYILVLDISHLTDGRGTRKMDQLHLTRREPDRCVISLFGHDLGKASCASRQSGRPFRASLPRCAPAYRAVSASGEGSYPL